MQARAPINLNLEKQVVSIELAKKLKELGVKQESLFWWVDYTDGYSKPAWNLNGNHVGYKAHMSAFTVAELGEMLWQANEKKPNSLIKAYGDVFNFPGTGIVGTLGVINLIRKPDMAAKMLIYLIENRLIDQTDPL